MGNGTARSNCEAVPTGPRGRRRTGNQVTKGGVTSWFSWSCGPPSTFTTTGSRNSPAWVNPLTLGFAAVSQPSERFREVSRLLGAKSANPAQRADCRTPGAPRSAIRGTEMHPRRGRLTGGGSKRGKLHL
jgi:hypothetical protein